MIKKRRLSYSLLFSISACAALTAVVSTLLISCASVKRRTENKPVIGFVIYEPTVTTFSIRRELQARQKNGILHVVILNAQQNTKAYIDSIRELASSKNKADLLLLQTPDTETLKSVYPILSSSIASVPAVFVDTDKSAFEIVTGTHKLNNKTASIVTFGSAAGALQAKFVLQTLRQRLPARGEYRIALLVSRPGSAAQIYRTQGVENTLAGSPARITHQKNADSQRIEAFRIVKNWLDSNVRVDAIIANDDRMALGAALAIKEKGLSILVVGGGLSEDGLPAVKNNDLSMTVIADAPTIVNTALQLGNAMINASSYKPITTVPPIAVTFETVDNFLQ